MLAVVRGKTPSEGIFARCFHRWGRACRAGQNTCGEMVRSLSANGIGMTTRQGGAGRPKSKIVSKKAGSAGAKKTKTPSKRKAKAKVGAAGTVPHEEVKRAVMSIMEALFPDGDQVIVWATMMISEQGIAFGSWRPEVVGPYERARLAREWMLTVNTKNWLEDYTAAVTVVDDQMGLFALFAAMVAREWFSPHSDIGWTGDSAIIDVEAAFKLCEWQPLVLRGLGALVSAKVITRSPPALLGVAGEMVEEIEDNDDEVATRSDAIVRQEMMLQREAERKDAAVKELGIPGQETVAQQRARLEAEMAASEGVGGSCGSASSSTAMAAQGFGIPAPGGVSGSTANVGIQQSVLNT